MAKTKKPKTKKKPKKDIIVKFNGSFSDLVKLSVKPKKK
jgi:hypothetical protein